MGNLFWCKLYTQYKYEAWGVEETSVILSSDMSTRLNSIGTDSPLSGQQRAKKLQLINHPMSLGPKICSIWWNKFRTVFIIPKLYNFVLMYSSTKSRPPISPSDDWYLNDSWGTIRSKQRKIFDCHHHAWQNIKAG